MKECQHQENICFLFPKNSKTCNIYNEHIFFLIFWHENCLPFGDYLPQLKFSAIKFMSKKFRFVFFVVFFAKIFLSSKIIFFHRKSFSFI